MTSGWRNIRFLCFVLGFTAIHGIVSPAFALKFRVFEVETIQLPQWDDAKKADPDNYFAGGALFPDGTLPKGALAYRERITKPIAEKQPPALKPISPKIVVLPPEPKKDLENLPKDIDPYADIPPLQGELLSSFFETRPEEFLIDPQRLMTEQRSNDIARFLEIHGESSNIPLYVIVIGPNQTIPESINLSQIHSQWFQSGPELIVIYRIHHPDLLRIVHSEEGYTTDQTSLFHDQCLQAAQPFNQPDDQLEHILIELSIQAHALTKTRTAPRQISPLPVIPPAPEPEPEAIASTPPALEPFDPPAVIREIEPVPVTIAPDFFQSREFLLISIIGSVTIFALIIFGITRCFNRRRSQRKQPILFPVVPIYQRLQGEYSGGSFVGISFDSGPSKG